MTTGMSADRQAARVAGLYGLVGVGWILVTDLGLWLRSGIAGPAPLAQTLKGLLFVVLSTAFIYWIVRRQLGRRMKAEAWNRRQAELLQHLGQAVIATDLDGRVMAWNDAAEELYGWSREEAMDRSVVDLTVPDMSREAADEVLEDLAHGDPRAGEFLVRNKEGEVFPAFVADTPLRDQKGKVVGFVGVSHDLRELYRTRAEAARQGERFRALIEGSSDVFTILEKDGRVRYVSPSRERIIGVPTDEVEGSDILSEFTRIHPDDRGKARDAFRRILSEPDAEIRQRLRIRHADGSWRLMEHRVRNRLDDPAVEGIVVNSRDVTETVELQEALLQAQKMEAVGRLAGGVAHDFNNLITTILGLCDILWDRVAGDPEAREEIEEIRAAGRRGADLTAELLAFSRQQVLSPQPRSLSAIIGNMESLLRRPLSEDVELAFSLKEDPWLVEVDQERVEQVVMNLVVNANDAVEPGDRIEVETAAVEIPETGSEKAGASVAPGRYVELRVSDTGGGMEPEELERVFEPFFTSKVHGKGTGLGLSTVYGTVRQSGGHVFAESAPGKGSTFRVLFPAVEANAVSPAIDPGSPDEAPPPTAAADSVEEGPFVLVVEDDVAVRRTICRGLEKLAYGTIEAASGREALELLSKRAVQVVVSDMIMPEMGGGELTRRIRGLDERIPVILISGHTAERLEREGLTDLADGFVGKPFTPVDLDRAIRAILDEGPER